MDKHVETLQRMREFAVVSCAALIRSGASKEMLIAAGADLKALDAAIAALQGIEAAEQRVREVEALPAKWRADAANWRAVGHMSDAASYSECADYLEAALQGTGSGSADNG